MTVSDDDMMLTSHDIPLHHPETVQRPRSRPTGYPRHVGALEVYDDPAALLARIEDSLLGTLAR